MALNFNTSVITAGNPGSIIKKSRSAYFASYAGICTADTKFGLCASFVDNKITLGTQAATALAVEVGIVAYDEEYLAINPIYTQNLDPKTVDYKSSLYYPKNASGYIVRGSGLQMYALSDGSTNIAVGDKLESNGTGYLIKNNTNRAVAIALDASTAANTVIRIQLI